MQKQFAQYTVISEIKASATSTSYLALANQGAQSKVLLKVYANTPGSDQERALPHMAETLKRLQHPHLVPILEVGIEQGQVYIVSEYMAGGSLRTRLDRLYPKTMPRFQATAILVQTGQALAALHSQQLVHGHLKPEHIVFDVQGQARLTGLTPFQNEGETDVKDGRYCAPEQLQGKGDPLSDQYALCCLAYELLSGKAPFSDGQHDRQLPVPLRTLVADLPVGLEKAVMRGLAIDPAGRHPNIPALLALLQPATTAASAPVLPLPRARRTGGNDQGSTPQQRAEMPPVGRKPSAAPQQDRPPSTPTEKHLQFRPDDKKLEASQPADESLASTAKQANLPEKQRTRLPVTDSLSQQAGSRDNLPEATTNQEDAIATFLTTTDEMLSDLAGSDVLSSAASDSLKPPSASKEPEGWEDATLMIGEQGPANVASEEATRQHVQQATADNEFEALLAEMEQRETLFLNSSQVQEDSVTPPDGLSEARVSSDAYSSAPTHQREPERSLLWSRPTTVPYFKQEHRQPEESKASFDDQLQEYPQSEEDGASFDGLFNAMALRERQLLASSVESEDTYVPQSLSSKTSGTASGEQGNRVQRVSLLSQRQTPHLTAGSFSGQRLSNYASTAMRSWPAVYRQVRGRGWGRLALLAAVTVLLLGGLISYALLASLPTATPRTQVVSTNPTAIFGKPATLPTRAFRGTPGNNTTPGSAHQPTATPTQAATPTALPTPTQQPAVPPTVAAPLVPTAVPVKSTLSASYSEYNQATDLTSVGTLDWMHWGYGGNVNAVTRKDNGANLLSNYSLVNGGSVGANQNQPTDFGWSDGTPVSYVSSTGNDATSCIYVTGTGNGFTISAPASTGTRKLYIYVGTYKGQGLLTASIQGASTYYDASLDMRNDPNEGDNALYIITFQSNVQGTRLYVSWTLNSESSTTGSVFLESAALAG